MVVLYLWTFFLVFLFQSRPFRYPARFNMPSISSTTTTLVVGVLPPPRTSTAVPAQPKCASSSSTVQKQPTHTIEVRLHIKHRYITHYRSTLIHTVEIYLHNIKVLLPTTGPYFLWLSKTLLSHTQKRAQDGHPNKHLGCIQVYHTLPNMHTALLFFVGCGWIISYQ